MKFIIQVYIELQANLFSAARYVLYVILSSTFISSVSMSTPTLENASELIKNVNGSLMSFATPTLAKLLLVEEIKFIVGVVRMCSKRCLGSPTRVPSSCEIQKMLKGIPKHGIYISSEGANCLRV